MIIYPAIDLIDGAVVRLQKGNFDQLTAYSTNPVCVAKSYADAGARWLHVVDLNGAKNPENRQIGLINTIIESTGLNVQVGGGIRSFDDVKTLIAAGASRVVIGSLAVHDTETTKRIFDAFGSEKICLAADVIQKNDSFYIAVSGWQEASKVGLFAFIETYLECGLQHTLCTDIDRDGALSGCNRDLYKMVKQAFPNLSLQASGGVSEIGDLVGLTADGVIIGKALYEGRFNVKDALEAVRC
jgi:phosphoribosylformimino-5-aminoimidazole carboxamide ribotide isomerase